MKPEVVNSRLKTFTVGDTLQGEVSSIEDEGIIVDLGRGEESRGFLPKTAYAESDRLVIGKSTSFRVKEVLLDGRQITLEIPRDNETVSSVSRLENLAPGQFVTFNSARQQKSGLVGRVFEFGATLHILQSEEDMLDTMDAQRIIPTRNRVSFKSCLEARKKYKKVRNVQKVYKNVQKMGKLQVPI